MEIHAMANANKLPIGRIAALHGVSKTTIYNDCTTQGVKGGGGAQTWKKKA
jgi:hypothetical protein